MAAYAIFIKEKTRNPAEMEIYSSLAGETLDGLNARVLAAYGEQVTLEGPQSEGVVLVEFPTLEEARAWYNGPAYTAARQHRFKGADYRAIFVDGL